jgi:hypothetical protein
MLDAKTRLVALAVIAGVGLSGCDLSQKDPDFPASQAPTTFNALYNPLAGQSPWPNDFFYAGTTDGTLNLPSPYSGQPFTAWGVPLNTLDGWSTTAPSNVSFSMPVDPASLTASTSVRMVEVYLSNTTKMPASAAELPPGVTSPVIRVLTNGVDYTAAVATDVDSTGTMVRVTPLKPLRASKGLVNIGYMLYVTNAIRDLKGNPVAPSATYAAIKSAPANCSNFTDAASKFICGLAKGQLAIAAAVKFNTDDIVLSWSYSTQSIDDVFAALAKTVTAQPITVQATGLTTKQVYPAAAGKANVYVGSTKVPFFLTKPTSTTDRVVLTNFWTAAGASPVPGIDPTSRNLTRFNPVPLKTTDMTIPVLVTVPNATAASGGCSKPTAGWPVVIVQHGLGGDRFQALAIADAFADACFVVAAIDQPLHGVTNTANPFYQKDNERTFNVDLVNNTTGATGSDGKIDASGTHWLNLSSPLTFRDNIRQGESDLMTFTKTVGNIDLNGDGTVDTDKSRVSYVGLSLGGIVGGTHVHFSDDLRTATLSVPGGVLTQLGLDSPTFGPRIRASTNAAGMVTDSTIFNFYFRDAQTLIDAGDPINHIFDSQMAVPLHLQKVVGDTVIPNSATDRLIAAGNLKKTSALGPTPVGEGSGGYTTMTAGSHGSLFDPSASLAATTEMQTQAVKFAASANQPGGPFVVITNPAVVQQ